MADTFLTDPLQVVTKNNLQFNMSSKYKDRLVELYFHKIYSAEHNPNMHYFCAHRGKHEEMVHITVQNKIWCNWWGTQHHPWYGLLAKEYVPATWGFTDISQLRKTRKWKDNNLDFRILISWANLVFILYYCQIRNLTWIWYDSKFLHTTQPSSYDDC